MIENEYTPEDVIEEWRDIVGYEGLYQVSNLGRVRRSTKMTYHPAGGLLKSRTERLGYLTVYLSKNAKQKRCTLHRLVAIAFLGQCPSGFQVNHKNGIKADNRLSNLEYLTASENVKHSFSELGRETTKGERHGRSKLKSSEVLAIRERLKNGETCKSIADDYRVDSETIRFIKHRVTWKHI